MSVIQLNCPECKYNNWQLVYAKGLKGVFAVCEECGEEITIDGLKNSNVTKEDKQP